MSYQTNNLPPGVSPSDDFFFPEEEPADVLYCEDPDCGYSVDAFELRYTDDPCCPDCACPLSYERPQRPQPRPAGPELPLAARIDGILAAARLRAAIDRDLRALKGSL